jgi:two-component system sensor histidine kinase YesM
MRQIKKVINNLPLYKKMLYIMAISIFCIYTIFFFSVQFLTNEYDDMLYRTNAALLKNVSSSIESRMEAVEIISYNILADNSIQNNLSNLYYDSSDNRTSITKRNLYDILTSYTFYNKYVESISLVFQDQSYICAGNSADLEAFNLKTIEASIDAAQGKVIWSPEKLPGNLIACSRQLRQIKYLALTDFASLYIIVDIEDMINDALQSAGYTYEDSTFILMANEKRIYPETPYHDELCNKLVSENIHIPNSFDIISLDREKKFIIQGSISNYNWKYLYFRDYDTIFNQIQNVKFLTFTFIILFCILILLGIHRIIKSVLWHLDYLIQKIQSFGKAESIPRNKYQYETRTDEIGQLHQSFDSMTKSVKILRDENYDKQILLKDTTIKMLQQQINPHFLYNTLDTINWLAQKYGAEDISTISHSLGKLFRLSISSEKDLIPLTEELSILDNYIKIQQIRFKDRMTFFLTTPDNISCIFVPRLCIQPLIENALKYSLEYNDDPCTIYVNINELEREYLIEVSNTGSQFEEGLLQKIKNKEIIPQGSGIGLSNIDSRLKLLYGNHYGLHLYNKEEMATVMLLIPKKEGE